MKNNKTPLVDEYLQSLEGWQEATTDEFFYTRLKARMDNVPEAGWKLPIQPVWVISVLIFLLGINSFMLTKEFKGKQSTVTKEASSIQSFAEAYDQTIHSSY